MMSVCLVAVGAPPPPMTMTFWAWAGGSRIGIRSLSLPVLIGCFAPRAKSAWQSASDAAGFAAQRVNLLPSNIVMAKE